MDYTKGEWEAYCLGSEGYQIRRNNEGIPAPKMKEELAERITPIVYAMGGSFKTQRDNANLIAAAPEMYEALKATINAEDSIPSYMAEIINKAIAKAEAKL